MANIFKRLKNLHNTVTTRLAVCPADTDLQESLRLLEEIDAYLRSFVWLRKQRTKDKMLTYLDGCFDYSLLCTEFGITYEQAKNAVHWAATKFENKIGSHTLKLIEQGCIDEARAAFYIGTGQLKLEELVTEQCVVELPEPLYDIFSLAECEQELRVLRLISKATLASYMESVDDEKMAYLMYLLKGNSKKAALFRPYLVALLAGDLNEQDLIEMENDIRCSL